MGEKVLTISAIMPAVDLPHSQRKHMAMVELALNLCVTLGETI